MCTAILGFRVHPDVPLIAAANRDEFLDRPSAPPAAWRPGAADGDGAGGPPTLFGPRDLRAGGTWMAVNRSGVLAMLTNGAPPDRDGVDGRASRGDVVADVLRAPDAGAAAERAAAQPPGRTRPYYLLIADARDAFGVAADDDRVSVRALSPGLHVQENRPLDDPAAEKVVRGRALCAGLDGWPRAQLVERLHAVLSDHEPGHIELRQLCVHTPIYGTRSSAVVLLGGDAPGWWAREGRPCEGSLARVRGLGRFLGDR